MFHKHDVQNMKICFRNMKCLKTCMKWFTNVRWKTWNVSQIWCSKHKMLQKCESKYEIFKKRDVQNMKCYWNDCHVITWHYQSRSYQACLKSRKTKESEKYLVKYRKSKIKVKLQIIKISLFPFNLFNFFSLSNFAFNFQLFVYNFQLLNKLKALPIMI